MTSALPFQNVQTPALCYKSEVIARNLSRMQHVRDASDCRVLYSLKACSLVPILQLIAHGVDGFSCSSINEFQLVKETTGVDHTIQFVSPGLTKSSVENSKPFRTLLTLNSIQQFSRFSKFSQENLALGIRVNPKTNFVKSEKYDPCRFSSKLGVSPDEILRELQCNTSLFESLSGLHFHNNCESEDYNELKQTVDRMVPLLEAHKFDWINLGGGYQISDIDLEPLIETVCDLRSAFGLEVFFEPGNGIVRDAGFLIATIIDLFESDGKQIAVLDTAVSHAPEVFEYGWSPPVSGSDLKGKFSYILAGCSCLAGDVFGEYCFETPKKIGDKVVFEEMGAYTSVKASWFNGICMPNIYVLTQDGELDLRKSYSYQDFARYCGVNEVAIN